MGSVGNATFQGTLLTIPVIVLKKSRGCKKKKKKSRVQLQIFRGIFLNIPGKCLEIAVKHFVRVPVIFICF